MNIKSKFSFTLASVVVALSSFTSANAVADAYYTSNVRLECESNDYATEVCKVPDEVSRKISKISLVKTYSSKDCIEGDTLEYAKYPKLDNAIITVHQGCRAMFNLQLEEAIPVHDIQCENSGGQFQQCSKPDFGSFDSNEILWVKDRKSTSSCNREEDYSIYQGKLEVRNGCRAIFSFYPRDGWE